MDNKNINILLVEDDPAHAELICRSFESAATLINVTRVSTINDARASIDGTIPDLVIADYVVPDGKGTDLIPTNKEEPPYPIVIMTSHGDEMIAVESIKAGAFDYVVKSASTLEEMPNICEKILLEWNYTIRHKRLEQELKESEARFKSILSSLYESAVVIHDRDGKITALWGTPEMDKRYGLRAVDAIGRSVKELLPPEQAEQRLVDIERVFDAGEKMLVEYMVSLPGGSFWHETSLSPMYDTEGNITAVVGFIRDITERKKIEERLKYSETRSLAWLENSPVCTKILDLDFNLQFMSCAGVKSLKVEDITPFYGKPYPFDFYPESFRNCMTMNLEKVKETGEIITQEAPVVDVEGNELWFHSTIVPVNDDEGRIDYIIIVSINTTERRKAEERVRKLSHAVEQSSSSVVITDAKGRIEYANPRLTHLTGYTIDEAIGQNPRIFKSGKTSPETYKELWKTIKSGNEWRGEFCNKKKNGELYWESASISPVKDEKNVITNFIAVKDDITEQKKMEDTLLQSEKLKSLGTITAGVAHEFNNILAVVIGSAEVLEGGFEDEQELKRGLKAIIEAGQDGAEIVKRMLTFAKAELSKSDYIFIDLQCLIKQAIEFTMPRWKNMAQAEDIIYNINTVSITETPEVFCNPTELREVFVNLIHNALDAMPDGGVITMATRCVRSEELGVQSGKSKVLELKSQHSELKDSFVEITFVDTGKGMPEEVKRKIFDPFFTTRRPHGTGLGMSVTYGVMKRHGGKIEVESEVGKGTKFTLHIPIRREMVQRVVPSESVRKVETKKLRVLVVDDEQEICVILESFLAGKGHTVKTVNGGAEAIELSRREDFDLVLCDLAMPEVTGHNVIKALNEMDKIPKIGISTGWSEKLKLIEESSLKVDFFIKKPFNLSELERKISDLGI